MATEIIFALRNPDQRCPMATKDVELNTRNRQVAIDRYGYGPMNPNRPNPDFWAEKAKMWNTTPDEALSARCGNCAVFDQSPEMMQCIMNGLEAEDTRAVDKTELGYCEMHHFKCAASRTCNTWVAEEEEYEEEEEEEEDES